MLYEVSFTILFMSVYNTIPLWTYKLIELGGQPWLRLGQIEEFIRLEL